MFYNIVPTLERPARPKRYASCDHDISDEENSFITLAPLQLETSMAVTFCWSQVARAARKLT